MPKRIQRKRTKGFNLQAASSNPNGVVYVGRPTKWGNPFKVGAKNPCGTITADKRHAWQLYLGFAPQNELLIAAAREGLRGKDLACRCPLPKGGEPDVCHAAILLTLANE
jgi:hypothetical protein